MTTFKDYFLDDIGFFNLKHDYLTTRSTINFFEITDKNKEQFEIFINAIKTGEIEILYDTFRHIYPKDYNMGFVAFRFICTANKSGFLICYTSKNVIKNYEFPDELKLIVELL